VLRFGEVCQLPLANQVLAIQKYKPYGLPIIKAK